MDKFCNEANYRFFNALANRTRLAIIDALVDKPKTATEISESLNLDLEASTQYLELMAGCMLLNAKGLGKEKRYSLKKEILEPMNELLAFHMSKYCPALKKGIPEENSGSTEREEPQRKHPSNKLIHENLFRTAKRPVLQSAMHYLELLLMRRLRSAESFQVPFQVSFVAEAAHAVWALAKSVHRSFLTCLARFFIHHADLTAKQRQMLV